MPDQVTSALLVVVAIAYLGGPVLSIVALAKALLAWSVSWRTSGQTSPVDVVLQQPAAAAMAAVAAGRERPASGNRREFAIMGALAWPSVRTDPSPHSHAVLAAGRTTPDAL
ncbi:hypothetical protein [Nocardioides aquaticus]|jgi:hypothetical protein|uniref:hypothetical protein n=1 Tax=Nocardioides aquaticus TaxID=160826 RepID=UPI001BD62CE7|nr:hypothetical protein [Nocardioides aquaticus]